MQDRFPGIVFAGICCALVITSGCTASPPAASTLPAPAGTQGIPATPGAPATVGIMDQSAACLASGEVSVNGTVRSTASRRVSVVVRGSVYNERGMILGSGSDFIDIEPKGSGAFAMHIPDGCDRGTWTYFVLIDEVF